MTRGLTKEYQKGLDESSCEELLNTLDPENIVDIALIKSLNALDEYFEKTPKEELQKEFESYFKPNKIIINPNLDKNYRLQKIIRNYQKFGNIVVGVDFDFTLVDAITGETYEDIVQILKRGQRNEITYCIWTANEDEEYVTLKWYEAGLKFQYYNQSPINLEAVKPHFNILLDDSAGLREALDLFVAFLDYLDSLDSL